MNTRWRPHRERDKKSEFLVDSPRGSGYTEHAPTIGVVGGLVMNRSTQKTGIRPAMADRVLFFALSGEGYAC